MGKVVTTLKQGGFELKKIGSTDQDLVNSLPVDMRENANSFEFTDNEHSIKTLGILWNPSLDTFNFQVQHVSELPVSAKDEKKLARKSVKVGISPETLTK